MLAATLCQRSSNVQEPLVCIFFDLINYFINDSIKIFVIVIFFHNRPALVLGGMVTCEAIYCVTKFEEPLRLFRVQTHNIESV